jgi:hypothetical protein
MGLLMTVVGAVVGYRTPSQVRALEVSLQGEPTAVHTAQVVEATRMGKVNRAWNYYLVGWAALGIFGLLFRFATRSDFVQGLGIAMVFFCGVGLLVDGFAERRAHLYAATLAARTESPVVDSPK